MNTMAIIGVILVVLGVVGLVYGGVTYTNQRNVIDAGDLHVQVDQKESIPLSPIGGAASVAAGIVLLYLGRRQSARA